MRSAVADYQVIHPLPPGFGGRGRFVCNAPGRLGLGPGPLVVEAVPCARWPESAAPLRAFASVGSEYLLALVEAGPDPAEDGFYLTSEDSRATLARPGRQIGSDEILRIVGRAALGAHALHEAGIAHGYIGPLTIHLPVRGAVLGPPPAGAAAGLVTVVSGWQDLVTMDPDLLRGNEPSRASDIWSLGATLHLCLSRRPLFGGIDEDAPASAVQRMMHTRPEIDRSLPRAVAEVVSACLAADPLSRPTTASEVAQRLWGEAAS